MSRTLPWTTLLSLTWMLLTIAPAGALDAHESARARYERAVRLYQHRHYEAALSELTRAYALHPSYKLLFNIAEARRARGDHAGALCAFERYLEEGGSRIGEPRRAEVQREIVALAKRVASLTVESDVVGADVLIDGHAVGTTPLAAPVLVNAGVRHVQVRHAERGQHEADITLTGGARTRLALPLR